jgi:signal transduction histidine kinase
MLSQIMASARLLLTLINNMLDVRKLETTEMSNFELTPTPLHQCMSDAVDFCMPFATLNEVS